MPSSAWKKCFFNDTATTEIYTFPYTTLFRSAEGITASEEEVEKEFANIAERYGLTVDKVKEIFADEETENIKSDIAAQKALDMITEAAVEVPVTEVEATVEDAE